MAGQQAADPVIEVVLDLNEGGDGVIDGLELLAGGLAGLVVHLVGGHGGQVHQAAHPDHEKLVQVAGKDGDEFQPFQHRHRLVGALFQHTPVKAQPA